MESDHSRIINNGPEEVAISVKNDDTPTTSSKSIPLFRTFGNYFTVLSCAANFYMALLVPIRESKESPFETNGNLFMIISVVALCLALIATGILISTNYFYLQSSTSTTAVVVRDILKIIGSFSAIVSTLSIIIVALVTQKDSRIEYVIIISVFIFAICIVWKFNIHHEADQDNTNINDEDTTTTTTSGNFLYYCMGVFVPVSLVLVLFVPQKLDWIVYSVIGLYFGMIYVSLGVTCYCFIIKRTNKIILAS